MLTFLGTNTAMFEVTCFATSNTLIVQKMGQGNTNNTKCKVQEILVRIKRTSTFFPDTIPASIHIHLDMCT